MKKKIVLMLTGLMAMSQVAMAEPTANYDHEIMPIEYNLRIPNPWQEYGTLKAACQAADIKLQAPEEIFGGHQAVWRSVPGDRLVEITYKDAKGQEIARVRKAKAIDDISGDYKQYDNIEKLAVGKDIVIVEGDNRIFCIAIWHKNGYSYSITLQDGVSRQAIGAVVADIL